MPPVGAQVMMIGLGTFGAYALAATGIRVSSGATRER
jgi:hypothetical protein